MAAATLCRGCGRKHDPLIGCQRAARMAGQLQDALQTMSDAPAATHAPMSDAPTPATPMSDASTGNAARCRRQRQKKAGPEFLAAEAERKRAARAAKKRTTL